MRQKAHNICFHATHDNSFRWLQYKVLNNILGTKLYRCKVKLGDNPLCLLCSQVNERTMHLFAACETVHIFWQNLKELIFAGNWLIFNIDYTSMIFGYLSNDKPAYTCKCYIWQQKDTYFKLKHIKKKIFNVKDFEEQVQIFFLEQGYVAKLEFKHLLFPKKECNSLAKSFLCNSVWVNIHGVLYSVVS